jgi:SAM-dependent methyltransferase
MNAEPSPIAAFYATPQGAVVARLLRDRLLQLCPPCRGLSMLGIGHPFPYLLPYLHPSARPGCLAVTLAQSGPHGWPAEPAGLSCTAEEDALPFADLSFDRVLIVHGLEAAENANRMLREAWRVLRDDGKLIVVVPNRRGLWALADGIPFGQGQPYSPGQLGRLLTQALFRIERRDRALYMPPTKLRLVLRGARAWERAGRRLLPHLAGVTIAVASKDSYAAIPLLAGRRRTVLRPRLFPTSSGHGR